MLDLYLRADTEDALIVALPMFRADDEWITASHTHALDVIGTLYEPAVLDENSEIVTPPVAKDGYHANLRLFGEGEALADDIPAEIVLTPEPVFPDRVWA